MFGCSTHATVKYEDNFKIGRYKTASLEIKTQIPNCEKELQEFEKILIEKLKNANIFDNFQGKNKRGELLITVEIKELAKVSKSERFWLGGLAGSAKIGGEITLFDGISNKKIGSFYVESKTAGGTIFEGTTEDVINKFADKIVELILSNIVS